MATFNCVKIGLNSFSCIGLKLTKNKVTYKSETHVNNIESLKKNIKNKENINFLLFETQFIKNTFFLSKEISQRSSINSMLYSKLQKLYPNINDIRFKYTIIEDNKNKDTIKYAVNGIYQNSENYNIFNKLHTFSNCNIISLENYALYSLVKKILKNDTFISIWYDESRMITIAGNKDELYYSRCESLDLSTANISTEIVKNILFVKQKVRELNFNVLTINSTNMEDETIFQRVYNQVNIPISSLIANKSMFINFTSQSFNNNLIEIGSLFIDYSLDFTSKHIKSYIQYDKILNFYIPILSIIFLYFANNAYTEFSRYEEAKNQNEEIVSKMTSLYPSLRKEYDNSDSLYSILDVLKNNDNRNITNQIKTIKDNIQRVNSSNIGVNLDLSMDNYLWKVGETTSLEFIHQKVFINLVDLSKFKNDVLKLEKNYPNLLKIESTYKFNDLSSSLSFVFYGEENKELKGVKK